MPDKQSDNGALVGVVPDGDSGAALEGNMGGQSQGCQILEVVTAASNAEAEMASEALETHEAEGEDVRVASGVGEMTMGRDLAELLKLEVKSPCSTLLLKSLLTGVLAYSFRFSAAYSLGLVGLIFLSWLGCIAFA